MSMSQGLQFDAERARQPDGTFLVASKPLERCPTCVWGDAGCLEGHCLRKTRSSPKPSVEGWVPPDTDRMRQLAVPVLSELQAQQTKANETLLRNLANRKATLHPNPPKQLDGSTALIHARRRVVQAVLGLAHFETKFGQGGEQLKNRKADLELAMIEWENEVIRKAKS